MSETGAKEVVPAVRFEGFDGDWETKKLLVVAPLQRGFDLPKDKMQTGIYPVVMSNGIGDFHSDYMVKGPGVVTGRSGTIGKVHFIANDFWPHNTSLWVTTFFGNEPLYIYYLYSKMDFEYFGTGSGVPTLNRNDIHEIETKIPTQKAEQTKISEYFQQLDALIAGHRGKREKLLQLKKALLEKMFPKQGQDKPEIRFAGFDEDWVEEKLTKVADIVGGGTPSTSIEEYWGGDIDWYSPTEIGNQAYATKSTKTITQLGLEKSSATILPAEKTVLFTSRAGIGDMAILMKDGATNQGFQSFVVKEGFDTYFVYSSGRKIKYYALKHASGSTFLEISGQQLGKMELKVPKEAEQTKIGELFKHTDTLINQHQSQINKLLNIKQACLAKMFV